MDRNRPGWILTSRGQRFWPLDPGVDDVAIEDIAHALSLTCRFTGHCREFYSVAEHSVHVSRLVQMWTARYGNNHYVRVATMQALLHDGSEAFLADVARPVKPGLATYIDIERRLQAVIEAKLLPKAPFGHHHDYVKAIVKYADDVMLATEAKAIMPYTGGWEIDVDSLALPGYELALWPPKAAEFQFLQRYHEFNNPNWLPTE